MIVRRNLYFVWLALSLNVCAPVFAYAHIHVGANGEIIEHCAAEPPGDADAGAKDHHSHSGKGTSPGCPHFAGFAASVSVACYSLAPIRLAGVSAALLLPSQATPCGRYSVRIAQQRAPPFFS